MPDVPPPVSRLEGAALAFVDATPRRFATLATINPDGTPHLAIIWYAINPDGSILINSRVGRRWPDNLLRDPRCSLAVENGMEWVAVRGEAEALHDPEQGYQDIASLAYLYEADDVEGMPARLAKFRSDHRITFHLRPRSITVHL